MEKIKVLRIITRLNIGGPTIHTVLLNAKLDSEKYESFLVAGRIESHESDMSYFADKYNIKPIYVSNMSRELRPSQDWHAFWEIYKIIRKVKPDIIHTHTAKAGVLGRLAAFIANVPIIIHTFHGNVFKGYFGKAKTNFFIFMEKLLSLVSNRIIVICKKQKQELLDLKIASIKKIKVVPLGFEFKNFLPTHEDKGLFRVQFNIPKEARLIGIIGRLASIKNHVLFLDIAEIISKKYGNIYFPIIGDGELRNKLKEEIKCRKIEEHVFITGFIKNLKPVYADMDLVLLTSHNEGTPVAIIEAMACGKIVISTNVGGIEDFIDNRKNGFYFNKDELKSFVKEIEKWLNHERDYKSIEEKAKKRVKKIFSAQRLINDIENIYSELIERRRYL